MKLIPGKLNQTITASKECGATAGAAMDQRGSLKKASAICAVEGGLDEFNNRLTQLVRRHASALMLASGRAPSRLKLTPCATDEDPRNSCRTKNRGKSISAPLSREKGSLDRSMLVKFVFALILVCLLINGILVLCNRADSQAFAERLGAVFYASCGSLTTLLVRARS